MSADGFHYDAERSAAWCSAAAATLTAAADDFEAGRITAGLERLESAERSIARARTEAPAERGDAA